MKDAKQAGTLLLLGLFLGTAGCVSTVKQEGFLPAGPPRVDVKVQGGTVLDWGDMALATPLQGKKPQGKPPAKGAGKPKPAPKASKKPQGKAKAAPPKAPKAVPPPGQAPPPVKPPAPPGSENEPLFLKFGPNIFVDKKTGMVTKFYSVPSGMGDAILAMTAPGKKGAPPNLFHRIMGDHPLTVEKLKQGLAFFPSGPLKYGTGIAKAQTINDVLLVTSDPDGLEAFERAFNLLFNSVPQVDITVRVVETSATETLDVGVRQVGSNPTIRRLKNPNAMFFQSFAGNFPNQSGLGKSATLSSEGLFTIGGIHDNWELNAILEVLQTQLHSDIVSQPRIAVRNGGVAQISTTSDIPYPNARISGNTIITTSVLFKKVGVTMSIRPTISGTDTIMLQINVKVDAITGYEDTDPIRTPVVSTRSAQTDVYVRDGQSVAVGGLLTQSQTETERKVPVLGDIPLLGLLFRSTYKEARKSEVIFFITPRIMRRGAAEGFEQLIPMGGLESSL